MVLPPLLFLGVAARGSAKWKEKLELWRQKIGKGTQETLYWVFGIVGFLLIKSAVEHFGWLA
jgi:hypothetical protein